MYQLTSSGFSQETMDSYVEGIAQSLVRAHRNLQPGTMTVASDLLFGASINRSPTSYLLNPVEERRLYQTEGGTDKRMLQLNFFSSKKQPNLSGDDKYPHVAKTTTATDNVSASPTSLLGILNWFAVHPTSMNYTNTLIPGDNKGYASYLMEQRLNGRNSYSREPRRVEYTKAREQDDYLHLVPLWTAATTILLPRVRLLLPPLLPQI